MTDVTENQFQLVKYLSEFVSLDFSFEFQCWICQYILFCQNEKTIKKYSFIFKGYIWKKYLIPSHTSEVSSRDTISCAVYLAHALPHSEVVVGI